ncbi:MAG: hypothetical protein HY814_15500 [Candidatus Riflebacteria bacterium]|nr:hypothetical protein [Candidatus Riflebacteria bacterium]
MLQSNSSGRVLLVAVLLVSCVHSGLWALSSQDMDRVRTRLKESKKSKRHSPAPALTASVAARIETAVTAARNLVGHKYDQTMGTDGGKNYAAGQIVCVDVPRLALLAAGIPVAAVLEKDARLHPGRYPVEAGRDNLPNHPIFARRTRNWLKWCRGNGRLLPRTATPKPGDVVFYGDRHIAFVTGLEPDGHYRVVECAPGPGLALEQYDWMLELRGWKATGFGRLLPLPAAYAALARPAKTVVPKAIEPKYAIENLQQNHPGLTMLAGLLARLNGRGLPASLIRKDGKTVLRIGPAMAKASSPTRTAARIGLPAGTATPAAKKVAAAPSTRLPAPAPVPGTVSQATVMPAFAAATARTAATVATAGQSPTRVWAAPARQALSPALLGVPADQKPYLTGEDDGALAVTSASSKTKEELVAGPLPAFALAPAQAAKARVHGKKGRVGKSTTRKSATRKAAVPRKTAKSKRKVSHSSGSVD